MNCCEISRRHPQRAVPASLYANEIQAGCGNRAEQVALGPDHVSRVQRMERPCQSVVPNLGTPRAGSAQRYNSHQTGVVPIRRNYHHWPPLHDLWRLEAPEVANQHHPRFRLELQRHAPLWDSRSGESSREYGWNVPKLERRMVCPRRLPAPSHPSPGLSPSPPQRTPYAATPATAGSPPAATR